MDFTGFQELHNTVSARLLKLILLTSLSLVLVTSGVLIAFDMNKTRNEMVSNTFQLLGQVKQDSFFPLNKESHTHLSRVITKLLASPLVSEASIQLPDNSTLVQSTKKRESHSVSWIAHHILKPVANYRMAITDQNNQIKGYLNVRIDQDRYTIRLEFRALITLITGITLALVLSLFLFLISPKLFRQQQFKNRLDHILNASEYDFLTRLPGQRSIHKRLHQLVQSAPDNQQSAILCLGFDDFTSTNTELKFSDSEHILIKSADRFRSVLAEKYYIGRLGEDRFIVIMEQLEDPYKAAELAQLLLETISQPFQLENREVSVSATIGITIFPEDSNDIDELLKQADFAMMLAKSRHQCRYQFYIASIDAEIRQQKRLEKDLHRALEHHELNLLFQPQISYSDKQLTGVEALLRWQHPDKGLIPPEHFIPMAEHNLDIIPIGDWVLESACHQLHDWHRSGHDSLRMSVNISAVQLKDRNLANRIQYLLKKYNIPPQLLDLEVTESSLMNDSEMAATQLQQIKQIGINLSLDDFGTGYSSLSYLKQFPFDKIKIDKSFIEGLPENKENAVIVDAIIQLGVSFGLPVIAEGVESREQELHLIKSGCQEGQGFLYGKPMTAAEITACINERTLNTASSQINIK